MSSCPPPVVGSYLEIATVGAALLGGQKIEEYRQNGSLSLRVVRVDDDDDD